MKIQLPNEPRGLPVVTEIEAVLQVFCQRVGLEQDLISVQVVGGDRRRFFTQQGVKLTSLSQHHRGVPLYIGCPRDTVEAFLTYSDMVETELFNRIIAALQGKRVFRMDAATLRHARNGDVQKPFAPDETVHHSPNEGVEPSILSSSDSVSSSQTEQPEITSEIPHAVPISFGKTDPHARLSADGEKLHLIATAFAARFQVNAPFSYAELAEVLVTDAGMDARVVKMKIRVLTGYGILQRLNPSVYPARYAVTAEAGVFANSPEPEKVWSRLVEEHRKRGVHDSPDEPEEDEGKSAPAVEKVEKTLQSLKEQEVAYQGLLKQIQALGDELVRLKKDDLDSEEKQIQSQVVSLEERLTALRERQKAIIQIRKNISLKEETLAKVKVQLTSARVVKSHEEFEKLKSFFMS